MKDFWLESIQTWEIRRGKGKGHPYAQEDTKWLLIAATIHSFFFPNIIDMLNKITICFRIWRFLFFLLIFAVFVEKEG